MDGDLGIVIEPESLPEDLHPFCLVDDQEEGVKGSCLEYKTRWEEESCYMQYNYFKEKVV